MSSRSSDAVNRHLRTIFGPGSSVGLTDRELLARFAARRDEAAFESLMARHGPMVIAACRTVLADPHAAEDAFQATFLILVRKAGSLWVRDSLAPWLHRVARRAAIRALSATGRRRGVEARKAELNRDRPDTSQPPDDLLAALHEEIDRLPVAYRTAILVCDIQGRTHEQAARELRWPLGTVKGRLSRARERLRGRLTRRGIALPAAAFAGALLDKASAGMPTALVESTIQLTGSGTAAAVPVTVGDLSRGIIRSMAMTKWKWAGVSLLGLGVAAIGAGVLARQQAGPPDVTQAAGPPTALDKERADQREVIARLVKEQVTSADRRYKVSLTYYESGVITIDRVCAASRRLAEAQSDSDPTISGRIAAARAHIDRMSELEGKEQSKLEVGFGSEPNLTEVHDERIGAEFMHARAKSERIEQPRS